MKIFIILFLITFANANSCINCHKEQLIKCKSSKHFSMSGAINITRKAFGIKDSNFTLQTLPEAKIDIKEPKDIVDDILRRKCLRCHLTSKQLNPTQNLCLACHNSHTNKNDAFKAKPTQTKCLNCHKGEYIGSDYLGRFPHDYDESYRSPIGKNGEFPPSKDGIDYHYLQEDIHHKAGLSCTSCHKGKNWERISCLSCHKNISPKNHKSYHKSISCSACHSSWIGSSYNLNLLRDDTPNYKQWSRLKKQFDPYLEKFLTKALTATTPPTPLMPDYLTNELKLGIWYSGWRYRRWENIWLVNGRGGKIELAKPMYQYYISYKNSNNEVILNSIHKLKDGTPIEVFLPKSPHTITKEAKSCEMCHESDITLNRDIIDKKSLRGRLFNAKILKKEQIDKLQSKRYKSLRAKMLFE